MQTSDVLIGFEQAPEPPGDSNGFEWKCIYSLASEVYAGMDVLDSTLRKFPVTSVPLTDSLETSQSNKLQLAGNADDTGHTKDTEGAEDPESPRDYEDHFHFDSIPQQKQNHPPEQSIPNLVINLTQNDDLFDALLNFQQPPNHTCTLLDYFFCRTSVVTMNARLHGMFFIADTPPTQNAPPELTCYRRNLFQVLGSITLPRGLRYIQTDIGERVHIMSQELTVSATESVEGHAVKLISVPWNTPPIPENKTEKEPTTIPLDILSDQFMDADYATFPIAWKRLQFRIATVNNGEKKELRQYFVVKLNLVATLTGGLKVSIAEIKSPAIVVRGRSPPNYEGPRDLAPQNPSDLEDPEEAEDAMIQKGSHEPMDKITQLQEDPEDTQGQKEPRGDPFEDLSDFEDLQIAYDTRDYEELPENPEDRQDHGDPPENT